MGDSENEPPSLYTAELVPGGQGEDSDSGTEEEVEKEEWKNVDERRLGLSGEWRDEEGYVQERLDYESNYLDYMGLGGSRRSEGREEESKAGSVAGTGLFGTLSSLFSSSFTRSTT